MNELQIFNNSEFGEVRTIEENGKILFCGSDIAKALGYAEPRKAISRHCKGGMKRPIDVQIKVKADGTPIMQNIEMSFITEGDVYRLIARSRLPDAEKFEKWIFDEVLPTIRTTGGYVNNDDLFINTYLPNADEATRLMFVTNLQTIRSLNDRVGVLEIENSELKNDNKKLLAENSVYSKDELSWKDPSILNALMRSYAVNRCKSDFAHAWNTYYKQLKYKYGIDVKHRKTCDYSKSGKKKRLITYINDNEMDGAIKLAASICRESGLDVGTIINEVNSSACI